MLGVTKNEKEDKRFLNNTASSPYMDPCVHFLKKQIVKERLLYWILWDEPIYHLNFFASYRWWFGSILAGRDYADCQNTRKKRKAKTRAANLCWASTQRVLLFHWDCIGRVWAPHPCCEYLLGVRQLLSINVCGKKEGTRDVEGVNKCPIVSWFRMA